MDSRLTLAFESANKLCKLLIQLNAQIVHIAQKTFRSIGLNQY